MEEQNMENSVRWSLVVSRETDLSLRTFLARNGKRKGDLSKFVEEAVRWRVLDKAVTKTKTRNAKIPPEELDAVINDAVKAVRSARFKPAI